MKNVNGDSVLLLNLCMCSKSDSFLNRICQDSGKLVYISYLKSECCAGNVEIVFEPTVRYYAIIFEILSIYFRSFDWFVCRVKKVVFFIYRLTAGGIKKTRSHNVHEKIMYVFKFIYRIGVHCYSVAVKVIKEIYNWLFLWPVSVIFALFNINPWELRLSRFSRLGAFIESIIVVITSRHFRFKNRSGGAGKTIHGLVMVIKKTLSITSEIYGWFVAFVIYGVSVIFKSDVKKKLFNFFLSPILRIVDEHVVGPGDVYIRTPYVSETLKRGLCGISSGKHKCKVLERGG